MSDIGNVELAWSNGLGEIQPSEWDALVDPNDPFCTWAFLRLLETSASVGPETGWQPAHTLLRSEGRLIGAAPTYMKAHSYGEYIFDWSWAQAAERARVPYYPKIVSAVPFTPATGRRLLVESGPTRVRNEQLLWQGLLELADLTSASGVHSLFLTASEAEALRGHDPTLIARTTHQFHWLNESYDSFDHWLSTFRSKLRKEARRERSVPSKLGVEVRVLRGAEITATDWHALHRFYRSTIDRKWGHPYLSSEWFSEAADALGDMVMAVMAVTPQGDRVAGALCFQRGRHLYGRYWGCDEGFERLHFELCYHRPIELCIDNDWSRFEAGAQGGHKLRRGLMPSATHSVHWLRHAGLAAAVRDYCEREARATLREMDGLCHHGPFRRDADG